MKINIMSDLIRVYKCVPKPAGHIYNGRITMGAKYLDWKAKEAQRIAKHGYTAENGETIMPSRLKRVPGIVYNIIRPRNPGAQPDIYNLVGGLADILKESGIWWDDNVSINRSCMINFMHGAVDRADIHLCHNIADYSVQCQQSLETLQIEEDFLNS
jgi:hypothetical protein